MVSKAQIMALVAGDNRPDKGANLLAFGPPGGGKSRLAAAVGLIENGWRARFARTADLVQRLKVARRDLARDSAVAEFDDLACVTKDQAETCGQASRERCRAPRETTDTGDAAERVAADRRLVGFTPARPPPAARRRPSRALRRARVRPRSRRA